MPLNASEGLETFHTMLDASWRLRPEEGEACCILYDDPIEEIDLLQVHKIGLSIKKGLYRAPKMRCFIACFSSPTFVGRHQVIDDDLAMWRSYGEDGVGAAIAFFRYDLNRYKLKWPGGLYKVTYDYLDQTSLVRYLVIATYELLQERCWPARNSWVKTITGIGFELSAQTIYAAAKLAAHILASTFKNQAFSYEREYRLLVLGPTSGAPYLQQFRTESGAIREYVEPQSNHARSQKTSCRTTRSWSESWKC